jgi:hypothetical protein
MNERNILSLSAAIVGLSIPGFGATMGVWAKAGLDPSRATDAAAVAAFAAVHPASYALLPVIGVIMHLAALVLAAGLHLRLSARAPLAMFVASALALFWVTCDLLQNLVRYGVFLGGTPATQVPAVDAVAERIWHAGHLGGGAWIALLALVSADAFGLRWRMFAGLVGAVFFLHPFVVPIFPAYFNAELVLVPVWCAWTAVAVRSVASPGAVTAPARSSVSARVARELSDA